MYDSNIYYHPEAHGLEMVGEIDWDDEPYQFCITGVWKKTRGQYYIASDSGCSCPSPFEDLQFEDLKGPYDKKALTWQLNNIREGNDDNVYGPSRSDAELRKEIRDLLDRLK